MRISHTSGSIRPVRPIDTGADHIIHEGRGARRDAHHAPEPVLMWREVRGRRQSHRKHDHGG